MLGIGTRTLGLERVVLRGLRRRAIAGAHLRERNGTARPQSGWPDEEAGASPRTATRRRRMPFPRASAYVCGRHAGAEHRDPRSSAEIRGSIHAADERRAV